MVICKHSKVLCVNVQHVLFTDVKIKELVLPKMLRMLLNNFVDLVFCRYVSQQRYTEAIDLLRDGALSLLRARQISSGADLGLLLISTLDKSGAAITEKNIGINTILTKNIPISCIFLVLKKLSVICYKIVYLSDLQNIS